jgi:hypothetical protein
MKDTVRILKDKIIILKINILRNEMSNENNPIIRDSISYMIDMISLRIDSLNNVISNYPSRYKLESDFRDNISKRLRENELVLDIKSCTYDWVSLGYRIYNNDFYYFDPLLDFNNQISNKKFLSHDLRIQYSYYNWTILPYHSFFWCIGSSFSYGDNFNSLNKLEISDENTYTNDTNIRKSADKYFAYTGNYKKDLKSLNIYGDYYHFLFSGNNVALNINPNVKFRNNELPLWNLNLGILITLLNAEDNGKSVVTTELYYRFFDIFKLTKSSYKLYENNGFGIRFSIPYNF